MAAPFFYLTGNALLAQNIVVVLNLALSAWAMFLLMREILGREDGALVAGLVYAFHTYNANQVAREQLLAVQFWPLAVLFFHRTFLEGKKRDAFLCAFFFTLQGLANTYYLFFFTIAIAFWIAGYTLFIADGYRKSWRLALPFAAAALVFIVVSGPYRRMLRDFGYAREPAAGVDLLEYVRPPEGSLLARFITIDFAPSVEPQFLGFLTLALGIIGLVSGARLEKGPIRLFFWISVATGVVGTILSLGPTIRVGGSEWGPGPYAWLYEWFPFFRVLRNAERLSLLTRFGLAVCVGFGSQFFLTRARWAGVGVLLLVLLPLEHFTGGQPFVRVPTGENVPEVYRWLGETSGAGPVVELPLYPREKLRIHSIYMFYSTYHWKPILFGRTSFYPPLTGYLAWELREFPDGDSIGLLESLGVERIIVHPNLWSPDQRAKKLAALNGYADRLAFEGRFPPPSGPVQMSYGFGDERVFRLRDSGTKPPTPPPCAPSDEIDTSDWILHGEAETPHEWAIDRDPETKWRTKEQLPGLKLEVDLGREETIGAIRIEIAYPHDKFPRDLTLKTKTDNSGSEFERVEIREDLATKWELVQALIEQPSQAAFTLRFEPTRARRIRFWVREGKPWDYSLPDWTMPELHIYRACS